MPNDIEISPSAASRGEPQPQRMSIAPPVWHVDHLRIATDAAGVALWAWDVDTDQIALDERAHRLWGITADGSVVTFEALSATIHPEDLDRVKTAFSATREVFGPYETDFRISVNGAVRWVSARGRGDDEGIVGRIMFGVFLDVTERRLAEQAKELIAQEMVHRIKNLFATVAALTQISARSSATTTEMAEDMVKRLLALGNAKELAWSAAPHHREGIDLDKLFAVLLDVYDDKRVIGDRIHVSMPKFIVGDSAMTTLALIVHELATNSLKYGALSAATGTLTVNGATDGKDILIVWTERGGPQVAAARSDNGFGSKLISQGIREYLEGSIGFDWSHDGVIISMRVSQASLAA